MRNTVNPSVRLLIVWSVVCAMASVVSVPGAPAEYLMNTPDGRLIPLKEGTFQPDLSPYQSQLPEVKILDRRFYPMHQQWAANEEFEFSQTGLSNMVRAAFPLAHNAAFIWLTNQQLYWNARNNLGFGFAASHSGINMVNGPYWTLKALELSRMTRLQRDRGERVMSNKDVMLQYYFPLYWKRIGIPRFPDDGQPAYLEFESGDPHFTAPTPVADTFHDPQTGKNGKWGVPEYFFNNRPWRWDHDGMTKYLNLGGIGIMLKRASMWVDFMWKSSHSGISPSTQHKKVVLMGNDAEEGFRGIALALTRVNQVLALKTELVADLEGNLGGINPQTYDPTDGLRYFPHRIWPNMLLAGDMPERQWAFDIDDSRSLLYDQGALLWGLTHQFQSTYRMTDMFTENPPIDGGIAEKSLGVVSHHLSNMVLKNILAMHTRNGLLVSEWQPEKTPWWLLIKYEDPGIGETIEMTDLLLTFLGLHEYIDRMQDPLADPTNPDFEDLEPELTQQAEELLRRNADFLLKVQQKDAAFCERYNVVTGDRVGSCDLSRPNFMAIGALTQAYQATGVRQYAEAARATWNYVWTHYWHEPAGVFRSRLGDDTVIIHALDIAAQLRAWREIMFTTPIHVIKPLINKFPRWTVQTMMLSGMIQAEENRSGELALGVGSRDWDNDGVPWLGKADGDFGIAPTLAHEIAINIGTPGQNPTFNQLEGEPHRAEMYGGTIRYGYQPLPDDKVNKGMLLPVKLDVPLDEEGGLTDDAYEAGWVERDTLLRWDGITVQLPPAKPFKRGSELTGRQIFEMNCAHCHGYSGEGITGIALDSDSLDRTRDDMFEVPHNGRFSRLMPEWGLGNQDEMESVLTDEEIYRIVDYIQSPAFKKLFVATQQGVQYPNVPPKDPYFYISRSYIRGKKLPATVEDIALVMNAQIEAIRTGKPVNVIQRLIDAERSREQKKGGLVASLPIVGQVATWLATDEPDQAAPDQRVRGWNPDDYKLVISYANDDQVYYASKPLVVSTHAVARAGDRNSEQPKETQQQESEDIENGKTLEQARRGWTSESGVLRVTQSFDPELHKKILSYSMKENVPYRVEEDEAIQEDAGVSGTEERTAGGVEKSQVDPTPVVSDSEHRNDLEAKDEKEPL